MQSLNNEDYNQFNFEEQYFDFFDQDNDMNISKIFSRPEQSAFSLVSSFHKKRPIEQQPEPIMRQIPLFEQQMPEQERKQTTTFNSESLIRLNLFPAKLILSETAKPSIASDCIKCPQKPSELDSTQPSSSHPSPILEDNIIEDSELSHEDDGVDLAQFERCIGEFDNLNEVVAALLAKPASEEDAKEVKRRMRKDKCQLKKLEEEFKINP